MRESLRIRWKMVSWSAWIFLFSDNGRVERLRTIFTRLFVAVGLIGLLSLQKVPPENSDILVKSFVTLVGIYAFALMVCLFWVLKMQVIFEDEIAQARQVVMECRQALLHKRMAKKMAAVVAQSAPPSL